MIILHGNINNTLQKQHSLNQKVINKIETCKYKIDTVMGCKLMPIRMYTFFFIYKHNQAKQVCRQNYIAHI